MKNLTKTILTLIAAGFALTALSTQEAQAAKINGRIDFAGSVMFDASALQNVTQVMEWKDVFGNGPNLSNVAVTSGNFSGVPLGTQATMATPWVFVNPTPGLWSIPAVFGGFTFNLLSATVVMQDATFLNIRGTGIITAPGFEDTAARWAFTVQNAGGAAGEFFSFSANTASQGVPDGGSAVALLGMGLGVIEFIRRKLRFRA